VIFFRNIFCKFIQTLGGVMKKIILLFLFSLIFSLQTVLEYHSNGMPKIVKTYNGHIKLQLTKEMSYYPDGRQKYQKKYYNGEVQNIQRWDESGRKIIGEIWTSSQESELMIDCPKKDKDLCECGASVIMSELSFDEYANLRKRTNPDWDVQKATDLEAKIIKKCGK